MPRFQGVFFDIDGVLEYQGQVFPGAVELVQSLRKAGIPIRFLTNSTLKSRKSGASKLAHKGFSASEEEVITASYATAQYLKSIKPGPCWVLLEQDGLHEFAEFAVDETNPEYIVIGDNRSRFDFDTMNRILRLLMKGAGLIGMIPELVDSSLGEPELNVGSWVRMLEKAARVRATYIGKPEAFMFQLGLRSTGLTPEQVLMVGDRVSTDVVGAKNVGIASVLVKTGEYDQRELDGPISPDFIVQGIERVWEIIGS